MTVANAKERCWFDGRAQLLELPRHCDARGSLLPIELTQLPFAPQRLFTVTDVPTGTQRGGHGHRQGQQLLICLSGQIGVLLRCGSAQANVVLDARGPALLIGAGIWGQQTYLQQDSALLVLASEPYDPSSYFQNPEESK